LHFFVFLGRSGALCECLGGHWGALGGHWGALEEDVSFGFFATATAMHEAVVLKELLFVVEVAKVGLAKEGWLGHGDGCAV
jgi:hypothetical protein